MRASHAARPAAITTLLAIGLSTAPIWGGGCGDDSEAARRVLKALQMANWEKEAAAKSMSMSVEDLDHHMRAHDICVTDDDCRERPLWAKPGDPVASHNARRCVQRHIAAPWASAARPAGDCRAGGAPKSQFPNAYYCDSGTGLWKERFSQCATSFDSWLTLGGKVVKAEVLDAGRDQYMLACRPCHGAYGDGKGPASSALRPPPRDLRIATYKFAGVKDGLPHDEDFKRILSGGLSGTAMLPWDITEEAFEPLIQYIKTFAPHGESWRTTDLEFELGKRVEPAGDPWKDPKKAIARGAVLYHAKAMCWSCHPAYEPKQKIYEFSRQLMSEKLRAQPITSFRPAMFQPEPKQSPAYRVGKKKMQILPPDFLYNPVRSLSPRRPNQHLQDLFRIIGAGIPGTAMPAWHGALPDRDVWAIAHYVEHLTDLRGTHEADALRARLAKAASKPFSPSAAPPPPAKPKAQPAPAPAGGAKGAEPAKPAGGAAKPAGAAEPAGDAKPAGGAKPAGRAKPAQ